MQAIRPRVFHKALILLLVPLVFEVAVAASLLCLQRYYEDAVNAEALRKQSVFHINEFWYYNLNFASTRARQAFLANPMVDETAPRLASQKVDILKGLLAEDAQQLARLAHIMDCHVRMRDESERLKPLSPDASMLGKVLALRNNLPICKELMAATFDIGALIRSFRQEELLKSDTATRRARDIALFMQIVLVMAVVGSAVIAIILFRYFMRGIHASIQALLLNIQRFKAGEALAPPIQGTDEIALLDTRFHEMAAEVSASQKTRQAYLAAISDELKGPITVTKEFLSKLSTDTGGDFTDKVRDRAQRSEHSLERLLGLMNDFVLLQAHGVAKVEVAPRPSNLAAIVQSSIDAVFASAQKSGIHLDGQNARLEVWADPDRIVQVLVNLLSNAIKFSPPGSSVIVSAAAIGKEVEVRVQDSGRGIPAHMQQSVFEKFRQVSTADATEKGGTGLGLPICKEIVELHGGSIGVESEEGKGSTFWFKLPAGPTQ